jgi:putative endonuclease
MARFYVYILANRRKRLYVGITSHLSKRMEQHKTGCLPGFISRYGIDRLVHYESFTDSLVAIRREKQLKRMGRAKKLKLVDRRNPQWAELRVE